MIPTEQAARLSEALAAPLRRLRGPWGQALVIVALAAVCLGLVARQKTTTPLAYLLLFVFTTGIILLRRDRTAAVLCVALLLWIDWYRLIPVNSVIPLTLPALGFFLGARALEGRIYSRPREWVPWARLPQWWLWALVLLLGVLAFAHSPARADAAYYFLTVLCLAPLFWALGTQVARTTADLRALLNMLTVIGVIVALHSIVESAAHVFLFETKGHRADVFTHGFFTLVTGSTKVIRASSFLGNPDSDGPFLALMACCALGLLVTARAWPARLLAVAETLVIVVALLFTYTAAAWIAFGCALVVFLALATHGLRRLYLFGGVAAAGLAGYVIFRAHFAALFAHAQGPNELSLRMQIWDTAVHLIRAHPLFGIGLGLGAPYERVAAPVARALHDQLDSHPHNAFLELAALAGIPLLLAFLAVLALTIRRVLLYYLRAAWAERALFAAVLASVTVLCVDGLADRTWTLPPIAAIGWLIVSAAAAPTLGASLARSSDQANGRAALPAPPQPSMTVSAGGLGSAEPLGAIRRSDERIPDDIND
jgi:O-antigen ligase/polysaccharide polymerase Wzy-like membrane protein